MSSSTFPHVICHMISTIDGKITGAGDTDDIFDDYYFKLYTKTEDLLGEKQGWLIGRVTMQMFASEDNSPLLASSVITTEDFVAKNYSKKFMFGVDTKGLLRWGKNEIQLSNISEPLHLVIVVTISTPKEYLSYLKSKDISYIFAGEDEIDFETLLSKVKEKFGVETLLLEGGGLLNGAMMKANLIDEISVVLTPMVINQSEAPSLFESKNNTLDIKKFSLDKFEEIDKNTLWLKYKKSV